MQMVMYVLDNADLLDEVLESLCAAGVTGATIVESTGMHRRRARKGRPHFRFPFEGSTESQLKDNITLFVIVPDEPAAQTCIDAIEAVVGDLREPNNGVLASWPLTVTKGLRTPTPGDTCAEERNK
ncbi:MAG: hypothetical protein GX557_14840 [Chloroflexi bacterium]|nr:hypothetical protein [Chloroflexota bacterium]